jgi:aminoglycoside phosphotransferase (APT) family kinase protein
MSDRAPPAQLRIARFLEAAAGASRVETLHWERLPGGAIQQNVALDVRIHGGEHGASNRWILRTDAPSSVRVSHTRAQEFELLRQAHAARVKAPAPLWACDDGIGPAFFVMERVPGVAAGPAGERRCAGARSPLHGGARRVLEVVLGKV